MQVHEVIKVDNVFEQFIQEAETWAQACDAIPINERNELHGMPISVKENIFVKGYDSTSGMTQNMFNPCTEDALIVQLVKEMGGVPFCMTNVSQACLAMQCSNPVYGMSCNPYNDRKECGGSSGGEGALIGGGGSILGIGSDNGGSLRNPAAFCGIYSIKPTYGRHIPTAGKRSVNAKNMYIKSVNGFMSASVDGLVSGFKAVWNNDKTYLKDGELAPIRWRDGIFSSKRYSFPTSLFYW